MPPIHTPTPDVSPGPPGGAVSPRWVWLMLAAAPPAALAWLTHGWVLFDVEHLISTVLAAGLLIAGLSARFRHRWAAWALFLVGSYVMVGGLGSAGQSLGMLASGAPLTVAARSLATLFACLGLVWVALGPRMLIASADSPSFLAGWSWRETRIITALFLAIGLWQCGSHYADRATNGKADWALDRTVAAQRTGDFMAEQYWHEVLHRETDKHAAARQ